MTEFGARVDAFLDAAFALDPVFATGVGNHERDGEWPDLSPAGRSARLAFVEEWSAAFGRFDDDALTVDERVDREVLLGELESQAFADRRLREDAWSPMWWVYQIGQGLFGLVAREFAPLEQRLTALASRAEGLPGVLDAARDVLVGAEDRPVDRLHAEKALEQ